MEEGGDYLTSNSAFSTSQFALSFSNLENSCLMK